MNHKLLNAARVALKELYGKATFTSADIEDCVADTADDLWTGQCMDCSTDEQDEVTLELCNENHVRYHN